MAQYVTLMREDAPERENAQREVFKGLRWQVGTGPEWRMLPHERPPWYRVVQQGVRQRFLPKTAILHNMMRYPCNCAANHP